MRIFLCLLAFTAVLRAADRTLLFVDDHDILYRSGTKRVLHPLQRHPGNPLLVGTNPKRNQLSYNTVYRDEKTGRYQIWYQQTGSGCNVAYAESADGIHWEKPDLGVLKGSNPEDKNLVLTSPDHYGACVVVDPPGGDPQRRYKMAYWSMPVRYARGSGMYVAFSPDGIHWSKEPGPVIHGAFGKSTPPPLAGDETYEWGIPQSVSDVIDASWDPIQKCYMTYAKSWIDDPTGNTYWKRSIVRTDSKDFVHWSRPELVMFPDEFDGKEPAVYGGSRKGVQLHGGPVFVHEGIYFSLLQVAFFETNGWQPIELAISRDGVNWSRPFRDTPFLSVDGSDTFDGGRIWSSPSPIFLADEFRFYYGAYEHPWNAKTKEPKSGIGLATMKRDRFAAIRPIEKTGQITLRPLALRAGGTLTLNADARQGSIRAELLDEDGHRLRGYTREDAQPITTDGLRHEISWKNGPALPGGTYMIRLLLENAEVFALTLR